MNTAVSTGSAPAEDQVAPGRRMNAIARSHYGSTDVLRLSWMPTPAAGPDEVVVEVVAAGLDRGVWHLMTGLPYLVRPVAGLVRPRQPILGRDLAGRVVATGAAVSNFQVGDEVMGIGSGAFAQFATARASRLIHKPPEIGFVAAAAVPTSGLTANEAVRLRAGVEDGQRVLVLGASGGVGVFAVQLAKLCGGRVTAVCSDAKSACVRSLGADRVIDYRTADITESGERFDVIIDIGGRTPVTKLRNILVGRGVLVIVGGENGDRWTGGVGRQLHAMALSPFVRQRLTTFITREARAELEELSTLMVNKLLTSAVARTYQLGAVPEAMRDLERGRVVGKAVVTIAADASDPDQS